MIVKINRKGEMAELAQKNKRHFSINSMHINVEENINSNNPLIQAAIKRDSDRFRQITDLSARLAAM